MHIRKAIIKNFRLLKEVELCYDNMTTLIVGRNNSGKTSLTELFRRMLSQASPLFRIEDFSIATHGCFHEAFLLKQSNFCEDSIRSCLPSISMLLFIDYSDTTDLSSISDFIIDLDADTSVVKISIEYKLKPGKLEDFFADLTMENTVDNIENFYKTIKERIPRLYSVEILSIDPVDQNNTKPIDLKRLQGFIQCDFVNAQRGLDDTTTLEKGVLSHIIEKLFTTALSENASPGDRSIAQELEDTVKGFEDIIDEQFKAFLNKIIPHLAVFGYPGLHQPSIGTETTLNVQPLLKKFSKIIYTGEMYSANLPESYNGLGMRNLIYILLKLFEYCKCFMSHECNPAINLIFIEEPETHLHPQMQEAFIRQLNNISSIVSKALGGDTKWPVQFVVTTHSSHIANTASFDTMRYFTSNMTLNDTTDRHTITKDLSVGLGGIPATDKDFLHKYMTLTKCDLLFADKAILVEGTSERLLLPKMIAASDASLGEREPKMETQYISVVEVGGAYAHLFFNLLDFLEIPALIITDIDSINSSDGSSCKVSDGVSTSNACLKFLFGNSATPQNLILKTAEERTDKQRHIVFQIPEDGSSICGRSFEDAFMLANLSLFDLGDIDPRKLEDEVWKKAKKWGRKKTEFALKYAIHITNWNTPKYITDGLAWLRTVTNVHNATVFSNTGETAPPLPSSNGVTGVTQ